MDAAPTLPAGSRWIVSRSFDLTWILGGAFVSLGVLALHFGAGVSILVLWWTWLLAFDGPHIAAAFTRTYADASEWRARRGLLLGSLLSFAVGPACLAASHLSGRDEPFLLFLGIATFYGYYHVVRQHYGFLALYKARNRDAARFDFHFDKWVLYAGCWLPYAHFLLVHPRARAMIRLPGALSHAEEAAAMGLLILWGSLLVAFLVRSVALGRRANVPKVLFVTLTIPLYGLAYFVVGRYEPVYAASNGPDQDFLLLSILVVIYHNMQYLALVWFHNRNRYAGAGPEAGPARAINASAPRFLAACGLFTGVYLLLACATGVFPGCTLSAHRTLNNLGLCFWWGLAIHHYYLDQKIWRIRGDETLQKNLGLI